MSYVILFSAPPNRPQHIQQAAGFLDPPRRREHLPARLTQPLRQLLAGPDRAQASRKEVTDKKNGKSHLESI